MAKILICDDDDGLRMVVKRYVTFEGHDVREACNGIEAVNKCVTERFDLIIMDTAMPGLAGLSAVKEIRKRIDTPIIMLTAKGEEYDKILGFELGVDDYITKPFSSKGIMFKVNSVLRRASQSFAAEVNDNGHIVYVKDGLKADITSHRVFVDGVPAVMTPKVYSLLFFLIQNKNIAVPREKIMSEVWGFDCYGDDRTLDTHIKLLRKSLDPYAGFITTLRGFGYRFDG